MANQTSAKNPFLKYLEDNHYEIFASAICNFVKNHPNSISDKLKNIVEIDDITPEELDFKMCWIEDSDSLDIKFEVAIAVNLTIEGYSRRVSESENVFKWWLVGAEGNLEKKFQNLQITYVDEYNQKSKPSKPLSSELVPIIKANEYEKYATDILNKYYPEALKNAIAPDMNVLVEALGLKLAHHGITQDSSIFGQAYFADTETELYSIKDSCYIKKKVPKNTIIVDTRANSLYSLGCEKMTIAHECIHFILHKKAFEFARLYEKADLRRVQCLVKGGIKDISDTSSTAWMETQANGIAPYLVMPTSSLEYRFNELVKNYESIDKEFVLLDRIEDIIYQLSEFFHVTKSAVRKRLVDIGVYEAAGTHVFVDGHYVKPFRMPKEALENKQTYTISANDVDDLMSSNPVTDIAIKCGAYQFVENHLVIDNEKFITYDKFGRQTLTQFARNNIQLCCIPFTISPKTTTKSYGDFYTICFLNKDIPAPYDFELKLPDNISNLSSEEKMAYMNDQLQEENKIFKSLTNDYKTSFEIVKKWRGVSYNDIAEALGITEREIERIMKGETGKTIPNIVSICLFLKLPYEMSNHIIEKSGVGYKDDSTRIGYQFLLKFCSTKELTELNELANELGVYIKVNPIKL